MTRGFSRCPIVTSDATQIMDPSDQSAHYERGPMILTSNQGSDARSEVSRNRVIATANLDRLLRHAVTLSIRRNTDCVKEGNSTLESTASPTAPIPNRVAKFELPQIGKIRLPSDKAANQHGGSNSKPTMARSPGSSPARANLAPGRKHRRTPSPFDLKQKYTRS